MKQVADSITVEEMSEMARQMYGDLVKAVVDIDKETLVVDMEMHADGEEFLLKLGSDQKNLWGINFYPAHFGQEGFLEFDSMINIRPSQNNRSRDVEEENTRTKIREIISKIVKK